jgi:transcriptional regulator with XRE-family HTH domain
MPDYAKALGARLRDVRQRAGLSLQRVEARSGGRWKAVVVGSYERGDRAVTVQKLAELAHFYGVPLSEVLPPDDLGADGAVLTPIVLNLERLRALPSETHTEPLARYAAGIARQRGSHETLLQVRVADLDSLAELYDIRTVELVTRLVSWGVLASGAGAAMQDQR